MNLRTYLEEYLETLQHLLQQDDSKIPEMIDRLWDQNDPRRLIFLQPPLRFGHLSGEQAQGSEVGPLTNQMPPGYRAHIEKYITETQEILKICANQDEQTEAQMLENEANKRWGNKDPFTSLFRWFRRR